MAQRPPFTDIVVAVFKALGILFLQLPFFLFTKLYHDVRGQSERYYHGASLGMLVQAFVIRSMTTYMPISITRYLADIGLPGKVLNSTRYAQYARNLFKHVLEPGFRGVWIIRNGFTTAANADLDPSNSDIVIYFLHGGGYSTNSPASYTLFLLRLAESIIRAGRTVSIFALDYSLAPEASFPTQLLQARKGYDWLVRDKNEDGIGIDRRKLVIMGDSAGGHLSLSLLVDLWRPLIVERHDPTVESSRKGVQDIEPCLGVALLSPWLSVLHVSESFTRNARTDLLTPEFLDRVGKGFLGLHFHGTIPHEEMPWLEFLDGKSGVVWDEVLPDWVWVSAGKNEIFYDDIVRWTDDRMLDCLSRRDSRKGQMIFSEWKEGEVHDYAFLKTMDPQLSGRLCGASMGGGKGPEGFDAIERIGLAILGRWNFAFGTHRM